VQGRVPFSVSLAMKTTTVGTFVRRHVKVLLVMENGLTWILQIGKGSRERSTYQGKHNQGERMIGTSPVKDRLMLSCYKYSDWDPEYRSRQIKSDYLGPC
jgi:hypothetical protein